MLRLIRQSRISRLYGSNLLRYYGGLRKPFQYAVLRLHNSTLYFDIFFHRDRHSCVAVRYKISGRTILCLYRASSVQNALLKLVLKHAKL